MTPPTKREILTATVESLEHWQENRLVRAYAFPNIAKWSLGSGGDHCPLCILLGGAWHQCHPCPLFKAGKCCYDHLSLYSKAFFATQESDKLPLIEALEKATIFAALDCFAEECVEVVRKVS